MTQARFIGAAVRELLSQVEFYEEAQRGEGARFTAAVERATARALAFPLAGSPSGSGTRTMLVRGYPFSVVYRPEPDGIIVFAVAHGAKRPGYWRSRMR